MANFVAGSTINDPNNDHIGQIKVLYKPIFPIVKHFSRLVLSQNFSSRGLSPWLHCSYMGIFNRYTVCGTGSISSSAFSIFWGLSRLSRPFLTENLFCITQVCFQTLCFPHMEHMIYIHISCVRILLISLSSKTLVKLHVEYFFKHFFLRLVRKCIRGARKFLSHNF